MIDGCLRKSVKWLFGRQTRSLSHWARGPFSHSPVVDELPLVTGSPEASWLMKNDWSQGYELSLLRKWQLGQSGSYQVAFVQRLFGCHTSQDLNRAAMETVSMPLQTVSSQGGRGWFILFLCSWRVRLWADTHTEVLQQGSDLQVRI